MSGFNPFANIKPRVFPKKHSDNSQDITESQSQSQNNNSNDIQILSEKTKDNTEFMTLNGNIYGAKVVHIYDGDTMHVVFKEFGNYYKWNCRVQGVDTPEIRTKNAKEKEFGYQVRDILRDRMLDKIVKIRTYDFDKYGRLLIDVFMPDEEDEVMLSQWLIQNKYAHAYDGGTKETWEHLSLEN